MPAETRTGVVEVKTYEAYAHRGERYWVIRVPGLGNNPEEGLPTQARSLAEAEPMVRDLIALWLDVPADSFDVKVHVDMPDNVIGALERARKYADEAAALQSEAAAERRNAARELQAAGFTLRDIGVTLGVSFQRASQLVS